MGFIATSGFNMKLDILKAGVLSCYNDMAWTPHPSQLLGPLYRKSRQIPARGIVGTDYFLPYKHMPR